MCTYVEQSHPHITHLRVNEQSLSLGYHSNRLATQTRCYRPNSCFLTTAQINIWKGKQYAQRQTRPQ